MKLNELVGKTFREVVKIRDQELWFIVDDREAYKLYHEQDCCESVFIEDVCGELADLAGVPLLQAEEATNTGRGDVAHYTWTFYRFATSRGYVTVRWYGESNGFYSESVDFARCDVKGVVKR